MRRRVRAGLNARGALAAHLEMVSGEMTSDLMRRCLLRELDRLEAGPFECRWWAMPPGFEVPGPPHGGSEWWRIELDGSLTELTEADTGGPRLAGP